MCGSQLVEGSATHRLSTYIVELGLIFQDMLPAELWRQGQVVCWAVPNPPSSAGGKEKMNGMTECLLTWASPSENSLLKHLNFEMLLGVPIGTRKLYFYKINDSIPPRYDGPEPLPSRYGVEMCSRTA